jgi:hypothetical protein
MLVKLRSRLTYANVMATFAVFIALGGSSYAALRITGKNVPRDALTGADVKNLTGKDVRNNTLTGRDIKNLTAADVANGRLLAEDFAAGQLPRGDRGPQGDPGPAGTPATRLFAYVRVNGGATAVDVVYGSGVTGVENVGVPGGSPGEFDVSFERSLTNCVALATAGFGFPRGGDVAADLRDNAAVLVDPDDTVGSRDNVARVFISNLNGVLVDRSFFIAAFC